MHNFLKIYKLSRSILLSKKFFFIYFSLFSIALINNYSISLASELFQEKKLDWKFQKSYKQKQIEWEPETILFEKNINSKSRESLDNYKIILDYLRKNYYQKNKPDYSLYLGPLIPSNIYLNKGDIVNTFTQKSAFGGGDAVGTGNQIYSYRLDYGLDKNLFISGIISEADDPPFFKISGVKPMKNFWRNYSFSVNKLFYENKNKKFKAALNSSFEYWIITTYSKVNNNSKEYFKEKKLIGSISLPISKQFNKKTNLIINPKISFLPKKIGKTEYSKNFYGNNLSIGFGLIQELNKNYKISGSYSFPIGLGSNSYDSDLNFSKQNIYSLGFDWEPNEIVGIRTEITNSFGETPSTSLLTIPSGNIPLYNIKLKIQPSLKDTKQNNFSEREKTLLFGGFTVNNATLPKKDTNQIWINYDNKGNYLGYYALSVSNILQLEIASIGSIKDADKTGKSNQILKETFFDEENFNNRFGIKLNHLSPLRSDPFWLSSKVTIGRNQSSVQGYLFAELLGTYEINKKIYLSINPKFSWNGYENHGGTGLGIEYKLNKNFYLIPELIVNHTNPEQTNTTFAVRRILNPNSSIDFYTSNALGLQDMSQLIRSDSPRFGLKLNFLF